MLALLCSAAEGGGFDPFEWAQGATFWTWVIFLLSLPVQWKFVWGPITKALADRDRQVVDAVRNAEEARRRAEDAVAAAQRELEQARGEGKRMVADAVARAERQAQEAQRAAKLEADRQLQQVREQITAEKRKALLEIRREVVDLSIQSAGRILRRDVDDEAHRRLVGDFLADLGKRNN